MIRSTIRTAVFMGAVAAVSVLGQVEARAASCSATEASEMVRLRGEVGKLAAKNAHSGVISNFLKMLDLAKQKCEIKPDDYILAANSSRNVGDIAMAITWFNACSDQKDAAELTTRFGRVEISEKAAELLKDGGSPFIPDERAALEAAAREVKANGKFKGYLPIGTYKLGTKSFEVKTSGVTKV